MTDDAISLLSAYFNSLWNGLKQVIIPGTDWSIADFFLAIFIAGMVGIVLHIGFKIFNNHFGRGAQLDAKANRRYQETKEYRAEMRARWKKKG